MKKYLLAGLFLFLFVSQAEASVAKVAFNTSSYKYHKLSCHWAKKCTKNCIIIDKEKAIANGGKPCKVCGG